MLDFDRYERGERGDLRCDQLDCTIGALFVVSWSLAITEYGGCIDTRALWSLFKRDCDTQLTTRAKGKRRNKLTANHIGIIPKFIHDHPMVGPSPLVDDKLLLLNEETQEKVIRVRKLI